MSQEQNPTPQEEQVNNGFQEHIRGVFSSQEIRKVGTGTTTRRENLLVC